MTPNLKFISAFLIGCVMCRTYLPSEVYCSVLGAHAVHVAMAGYTGIVVGKVDERFFAPKVGMTR